MCSGKRNPLTTLGRYAIKNIRERLRLKYHDRYHLDIQSSVGKGTTVVLEIPVEEWENV